MNKAKQNVVMVVVGLIAAFVVSVFYSCESKAADQVCIDRVTNSDNTYSCSGNTCGFCTAEFYPDGILIDVTKTDIECEHSVAGNLVPAVTVTNLSPGQYYTVTFPTLYDNHQLHRFCYEPSRGEGPSATSTATFPGAPAMGPGFMLDN